MGSLLIWFVMTAWTGEKPVGPSVNYQIEPGSTFMTCGHAGASPGVTLDAAVNPTSLKFPDLEDPQKHCIVGIAEWVEQLREGTYHVATTQINDFSKNQHDPHVSTSFIRDNQPMGIPRSRPNPPANIRLGNAN